MTIMIEDVSRRIAHVDILEKVRLDVREGEFIALLGPSGSGKTTLLRIIAGLDFPDAGRVLFDEEDVTHRPARERGIGFVFQNYALFRHMTVAQNIAFGLSVRPRHSRPSRDHIAKRVQELLALVQLDGLGGRYPANLSGGQRQRVALARALAVEPRLLLLDEPFGALDARVRKELRVWLRRLHDENGLTTIFVTHDQGEALDLADRVVILNQGRIAQIDTPRTLYEDPADAFVCDFLGETSRHEVEVDADGVHLEGTVFPAPGGAPMGKAQLFVRSHEWRLASEGEAAIAVIVRMIAPVEGRWRLEGETQSGRFLEILLPALQDHVCVGARLFFTPTHLRLYAMNG